MEYPLVYDKDGKCCAEIFGSKKQLEKRMETLAREKIPARIGTHGLFGRVEPVNEHHWIWWFSNEIFSKKYC